MSNKRLGNWTFGNGGGKIDKKTTAISLIMLTALAATVGAITMTAFAATATDSTTDTAVTADPSQNINQLQFGANSMMEQCFNGFGGGPRGHGGHGGFMMGGMGNIEVSEEYTLAINAILGNDSDVANLLSQGYNVTAIKPILKTVVGADGTVTTKATTAVVFMQGNSGFATIKVDVTNQAVTEIVTITRTVIDKTNS